MQKSLRTPRQQLLLTLLVEARKERNLTQADVAAALGKPQSFVAKYENGERRIDVVELVDIAAALNISSADILAQIESATDARKRFGSRSSKS